MLEDSLAEVNQQVHPRLAASGLNSLASVYMRMGRLVDAEPALQTSARLYYEAGDRANYAAVLSRTSQLHKRLGDYSQATHFLSMSTEIREQLGQNTAVAHGNVRLSHLVRAQGDFTQARTLAQTALDLALEIRSLIEQQTANASLAATALAAHKYADAEIFANRAYAIAQQRGKPEAILQTRLTLFAIALAQSENLPSLQQDIQQAIAKAGIDGDHYLGQRGSLLMARIALKRGHDKDAHAKLTQIIAAAEASAEEELAAEARFVLAEGYLPQQPQRALQLLEDAQMQSMVHYPYMLLKAKSLKASGQNTRALEAALEAKQTAGDWWNNEDEAFLQSMMDSQST